MSGVTPADVEAAKAAADDARAASKTAHDDLAKTKADHAAAQEAVKDANAKLKAAADEKSELDQKAAQADADASASKAACDQATSEMNQAEAASALADARATRVQNLHPGQCTPDTAAADADAERARANLDAARARQKEKCAKAADDAKKKKEADEAATEAAGPVADAEAELEEAKQAETAANGAVGDATTDAAAAALAAFMARNKAEALAAQLSAQGTVTAAPAAQSPDTSSSCAVMGTGPAGKQSGGIRADTRKNFTMGGRHAIFQIDGQDQEQIDGNLVEITVGNKISSILGVEMVKISGGKLEEVGGWESKLVLGGDRRFILGARWERNCGLKAESVMTTVKEITMGDAKQHVLLKKFGINPTQSTEATPEMISEAAKVVAEHKDRLKDLRRTLKENLTQATESFEVINTRINYYNAEIKNIRRNIEDKFEKMVSLKIEAKKCQVKSDAFIKYLVQGTCTLKCGQFKGSAKKKYHLAIQAIAQLQGQVKWN